MSATDPDELMRRSVEVMNAAWRDPGYCVPNQAVYPHQWLWDSCFHAVVWTALGTEDGNKRAELEITHLLAKQSSDGFVPHMTYWSAPDLHADFWGRSGASSITQPPMYGHAIAVLAEAGQTLPRAVVDQAADGLAHLGRRPRTAAGLIPVYHPWETGCDDSARWDSWLPGDPPAGERQHRWKKRKGELVAALQLGPEGHAIGSDEFAVGSIGFNALVGFNARELVTVAPWRADELAELAADVNGAVGRRWTGQGWSDDGPPSGRIRTLDSLLALLVDPRPDAFHWLTSSEHFSAPFGPRGVDACEPSYDPGRYWRGPSWPQLSYLMMIAAQRAGDRATADVIATSLVAGALESDFAEYWNPETGEGLGATPQTWAALAVVAAGA